MRFFNVFVYFDVGLNCSVKLHVENDDCVLGNTHSLKKIFWSAVICSILDF